MTTKLPYLSKSSLLAAHAAGQKFEIVNPSGRYPVIAFRSVPGTNLVAVKTAKHIEYTRIRADGSFENPAMDNIRLEKAQAVEPVPDRAVDQVDFHTADAARGAIATGMKFKASTGGAYRAVKTIDVRKEGNTEHIACLFHDGGAAYYKLDGSHVHAEHFKSWHLCYDTLATLRSKVNTPAPAPVPAAPVVTHTLIEAFFAGKAIHTPHTREVVVGLQYDRDGRKLQVKLRDEAGKERVTPRYNMDGTHRFRSERNLVVGPLPKKVITKQINVAIHRAANGSLFVIREGEVIPSIRGYMNAPKVGSTVITETVPA